MIVPKHLANLLQIEFPILQAPMAGGYTSPELVAAVSNNKGLGAIAAGYLNPYSLQEAILNVKALTPNPFQVNFFVPHRTYVQREEINAFINHCLHLDSELHSQSFDVLYNENNWEIHELEPMVECAIENGVSVVSFTFGVPDASIIARLKSNNIKIIGTATHLLEAFLWQERGADVIILQGNEAGGYRHTFIGDPLKVSQSIFTLLQQGVRELNIPVIASGGLFDANGMGAAFCLGASAVMIGTAFLTTEEANTTEEYKNILLNSNELDSILTNLWSGNYARAIRTEGLKALEAEITKPLPFPAQEFLIKQLLTKHSPEKYQPIFAGVNAQYCSKMSAKELMQYWIQAVECL